MGIDTAVTQLLFAARSLGADFTSVLTVGRHFFYPERGALDEIFRLHGIRHNAADFLRDSKGWCEPFFELLGANIVVSMDASGFEGASIVHDLNKPIPNTWKQQYSVVFDGGTLEHVFDFPQALRNCMEMVKPGGWFIQVCPANNFMGHGFYQVSPELVYRVFSTENGYAVVAMLLQEAVRGGRWYAVSDPALIGRRVQMTNRIPVNLCTIARRISDTAPFQVSPQQSDYSSAWQRRGSAAEGPYKRTPGIRTRTTDTIRRLMPPSAERLIRALYSRSLRADPACFRHVSGQNVTLGKLFG